MRYRKRNCFHTKGALITTIRIYVRWNILGVRWKSRNRIEIRRPWVLKKWLTSIKYFTVEITISMLCTYYLSYYFMLITIIELIFDLSDIYIFIIFDRRRSLKWNIINGFLFVSRIQIVKNNIFNPLEWLCTNHSPIDKLLHVYYVTKN